MIAKKEVSFLPDSENINSLSSRIVTWLTTVGRFVIVFTELIVICAFLSRFWLDRINSDLSEVVRQQKAILDSTAGFEKEYSQLQKRLKLIGSFYNNQPEFQSKLDTLVESTPSDIIFTDLTINRDAANNDINAVVSLVAYQESSIVDFITNLMANTNISSVNIKNIDKKPQDAKYNVNLALVFAKNKK